MYAVLNHPRSRRTQLGPGPADRLCWDESPWPSRTSSRSRSSTRLPSRWWQGGASVGEACSSSRAWRWGPLTRLGGLTWPELVFQTGELDTPEPKIQLVSVYLLFNTVSFKIRVFILPFYPTFFLLNVKLKFQYFKKYWQISLVKFFYFYLKNRCPHLNRVRSWPWGCHD